MSVINTNITSMIGQQNLSKSQNALTTSMERLSSGLRINSAKDDAAGQAIANRMSSQITGLSQAQRNANDGISIAQTAEGALNQVNDNLQRVRELAVQAQNGTNSTDDLQSIQDEINQRLEEIDRISGETNFNGTKVLASEQGVSIQVGANDGEAIKVNLKEITAETLGLGDFSVSDKKVEFSDSIARKSDVSAITNVAIADDTAFDTNGTNFSAAPLADDTATLDYFNDATGITATATGDLTNSGTGANKAVYSVKIDGGDYFVAQDADNSNQINLLKQDGTGGYEKVQVENANGDMEDVQVAVFNGKTTAFVDSGAPAGAAQEVDLTQGLSNAQATDLLAKNDSNLAVNIDGQNYNVQEIQENGEDSGKYGVRMDDGTVLAVAFDTATGNVSIQEDADGNRVEYALQTDGNVAAVVNDNGTLKEATLNATFNGVATAGGDFDTDLLQTTGTAKPLEALDNALKQVDSLRSELGAVQNRFESAIENLSTNETNLSAARSRIEDADYATEVADMTRAQILQQAGTSVLAQANQIPQNVLSLLG